MALYYFQLPQELSQFCLIYAPESCGTQSITDVHTYTTWTQKNVRVLINKFMMSAKELSYITVKERGGNRV
jgi:hypothetical protein